ncbi:hypothetical protein ACFLY4_06555 [Chloroflexota bacterium]
MTTANNKSQQIALWLRWIARIISSLAAAFWLFILIDILLCDLVVGCISVTWDMALLLFLVVASITSVAIAWRWENIGGPVLIFWGFAFAAIAYVTSRPHLAFSMLVTGVPFLIAGLFFLASWSSRRIVLNH